MLCKALLLSFMVVANCQAAENAGWAPLFDGKTLNGWKQRNGWATYEVVDGTILGTTAVGSPNSFLCTEKHYGDFELEFEVMVDKRLNSGVQIRSNSCPEYRNRRVHGYQIEISTNGNAGFIYDEARRGWLSKDRTDEKARAAFKDGQWNKYRAVCVGDSIKTWINGVPVADVVDGLTPSGFIGLQVHGFKGKSPAQVRWRNIRIRALPAPSRPDAPSPDAAKAQAVIDRVEKHCLDRHVWMIGRPRAKRLAELVRRTRPRLVVECGTAIGYSGLWILKELKAIGKGKLITIELDPKRAKEAEGYFREAGLSDFVEVRTGDARQVVKSLKGKVDFLFIDCGFGNYESIFQAMERKLRAGALVVADNAGIGAQAMKGYLDTVRGKYQSRTEWFPTGLWTGGRDAMEVTVINTDNVPPPGFKALFNGEDFSGWKVPAGDGGHWRVIDGIIDYDAQSEAKGDKSLWGEGDFGDFVLRVDWRIKETPYVNAGVPKILPDGTHAKDEAGKEIRMAIPDSDSGIFLRGAGKNQVNIWCWPIGSGEFYGYRTDRNQPPEVRAGVTPRKKADKPIGRWNRFEITMRGDRATVVLNGETVIENAQLPGIAPKGPIALQHHGGKRDGQWVSPPSLLQFKNIFIKELDR